ncbi:matrixin family metalloprotease [Niallia circulans]|uniref:matrixin family metalloprotease n=1 Tax=Niallia circulans TaxID=1397 RepID=UPI001C263494|nr:matrixin family metalloprotease [Niallia circulans]
MKEFIAKETAVHEFGHTIGLDHTQKSNESKSVMRAKGFNDKAYPLSDDKAGLNYIY